MTEPSCEDLAYQNELLKAELALLHSYVHGLSLQVEKHGHFFVDGTGAIGIETGLYYSAALRGATLEEDYKRDIMWAVPAQNIPACNLEEF